ncbi:hypothetical protein ABT157_12875 [Streptomyces viridosporus]
MRRESSARAPLTARGHETAPADRAEAPAPGLHHFLRNKKQGGEEYRSEVTAFELRKTLPVR